MRRMCIRMSIGLTAVLGSVLGFGDVAAARESRSAKHAPTSTPATLLVRVVYHSSFELGHVYHFTIVKPLSGPGVVFLQPDDPKEPVDGVLMSPPLAETASVVEILQLTRRDEPRLALMVLSNSGRRLDDIPLFTPRPGTGLGSFVPAGSLDRHMVFWRLEAFRLLPTVHVRIPVRLARHLWSTAVRFLHLLRSGI